MSGKFLRRDAIISTIKGEERTNAAQNRAAGVKYHVDVVPCGCSDESCGAFHKLRFERPLPTQEDAERTLRSHKKRLLKY